MKPTTILKVGALAFLAWSVSPGALADSPQACSQSAALMRSACRAGADSDFFIEKVKCFNESERAEKRECVVDAREERWDARETCGDQYGARLDACDDLGEAPHDPSFEPEDFEESLAFLTTPNPYFPMAVGHTWTYGGSEVIEIEVLDETKEVLGVNCIVVHDRVWEVEAGEETLLEDTDDWYAQDLNGHVWYFGEIVLNYEDGELVDIEGSWTAGEDYAKPGYIMLADPQEGDYYRQEFALGNAEDMGAVENRGEEIVDVTYDVFTDDVLKTRDWTPIEPDVMEFKYYAPGVGMVKEIDPESGEQVSLIDMTTP